MIKTLRWIRQFVIRKTLDFPTTLSIESASVCNLKCSFCPQSQNHKGWKKGVMSMATFDKVMSQIPHPITLTLHKDGEPFLNKNLPLMIRKALLNGHKVVIHTNALLLNDELIKKIPNNSRLTINVSVHPNQPYYSSQIDTCTNIKVAKNKVNVGVVTLNPINKVNENWIKKFGVNYQVLNFKNWAGSFKHETKVKRRPCNNLYEHPAINWNGDVMICCQVFGFDKRGVIGNVYKNSIADLWQGSKLRSFRVCDLTRNPKMPCGACTSWQNYPDLWSKSSIKETLRVLK